MKKGTTALLAGRSFAKQTCDMAISPVRAFSVAVVAFIPSVPLIADEAPHRPSSSKHISDAIQAGFRKEDPGLPAPSLASPPVAAAPMEVEPEVVTLPVLKVRTNRGAGKLDQNELKFKTEGTPLIAGTGITEFKGRKFTILIPRIFFIPVGFKIKW